MTLAGSMLRNRGGGGGGEFLHVTQEGASQNLVSATWDKRLLDVVKHNDIAGASLATSQITLPAGTYKASIGASIYQAVAAQNWSRVRLRDTTGSANLVMGYSTDRLNDPTTASQGWVTHGEGIFTISVTSVIELQHYSSLTGTNAGGIFGVTTTPDILASVMLEKIA